MWAIAIAVAAVLISASAAGISLQQLREARKANTLPATVDLFREYRASDMVEARRIIAEQLPLLDPENGVRGLPDNVAQAALKIGHYLDNLGVQVAHGLLAPELAAGFLGDSTIRLWTQLRPFILQERTLRSPNAYLQYFEHLATRLRAVQPEQVRAMLLTWPETDDASGGIAGSIPTLVARQHRVFPNQSPPHLGPRSTPIPAADPPYEQDETDLAASEAAMIGGVAGDETRDPSERAVREAGGGEAEGFEEAEAALIDHASHGDQQSAHAILHDASAPEENDRLDSESDYGEADHEQSSELDQDVAD